MWERFLAFPSLKTLAPNGTSDAAVTRGGVVQQNSESFYQQGSIFGGCSCCGVQAGGQQGLLPTPAAEQRAASRPQQRGRASPEDVCSGEEVIPPASPRRHSHTSEPFSVPARSSPLNSWIISFAPRCIIGTHAYAEFKLYIYNYTLCLSKECKLRAPMGLNGFNCRAEVS